MSQVSSSGSSGGGQDSTTSPSSQFSDTPLLVRSQREKSDGKISLEPHALPLENYLPIGCLCSQSASTFLPTPGEWAEVIDLRSTSLEPVTQKALTDLIRAKWIRVLHTACADNENLEICRIYILADDRARASVDRTNRNHRRLLDSILPHINTSSSLWHGVFLEEEIQDFQRWATPENCSLFYLFNTLPSPNPDTSLFKDKWSRIIIEELLESESEQSVWGLKTSLYPYQKRAVASMVQREVAPQMQLDPRLEHRYTPTKEVYYYSARDGVFLAQPKYYDTPRGGILAETMGLGKTIICIATILTTKGQLPLIPPQYAQKIPERPKIASLLDMCAATIARNPIIPWRQVLDRYARETGDILDECSKAIESCRPTYDIPPRKVRSNRSSTVFTPPEKILLSGATLVIVPRNLVHQWQSELRRHVENGALKVLTLDNTKTMVPCAADLMEFDVILFSRPRFEFEFKDREELYNSPLKDIHWLRIIIDEGHGFSSSSSHAAIAAEKHVRAERRWIVSGTPAKDLLGVEVEVMNEGESSMNRNESLLQRKHFDRVQEESSGAIKALGSLASHFLKVQPWASSILTTGEEAAVWDEYVYRHEDVRLRTYSAFSSCLRRTLESLVVKTRPEDVERDLSLPELTHKIIRLTPSVFDKFSANLFVNVFTANAVTSERTDMDYLFHRGSRGHLQRLVGSLRQSGFIWNGFKESHILQTLEVSRKYLAKQETQCSASDRKRLQQTSEAAQIPLSDLVWQSLTATPEVGVFVEGWPEESRAAWAFEGCNDPMVTSLAHIRHAQRYINSQLGSDSPLNNLGGVGEAARAEIQARLEAEAKTTKSQDKDKPTATDGESTISVTTAGGEVADKRLSVTGANQVSPKKRKRRPSKAGVDVDNLPEMSSDLLFPDDTGVVLNDDSSISRVGVIGTSSAKCSYLIDQISQHYQSEKILLFYDSNNIAFYLSEALDMLGIKHLIYANTLTGEQRSKWIVLFDTDPSERVLLMDIKQAAHGLNLSSASRVYFVNPVLRPNVEAQAIKRAHRIGQTKPVHVETLLLKGTIEEAMHDRSANMTKGEHLRAKTLEEDEGIRTILQQARILPVSAEEMIGLNKMAPLAHKQQLFGRPSRAVAKKVAAESNGKSRRKGKQLNVEYRPPVSPITAPSSPSGMVQSLGEPSQSDSLITAVSSLRGAERNGDRYTSIFGGG